jgi:membrane-associated phospholipid phosphatase
VKRTLKIVGAVAGVAALCLAGIGYVDLPVARWMHEHAPVGGWPHNLALLIGELGRGQYIAVPALFCALLWWRRRQPAPARAALLVPAVWLLSVVAGVWLKCLFGRCRPGLLFAYGAYGFRWFETERMMHSFPSGHTTGVFAVAALLWGLLPRWRPLWAAAAVLMAAARVVSQHHYPSDTLAGAALGIGVTQGVIWALRWRREGEA